MVEVMSANCEFKIQNSKFKIAEKEVRN